MALIFLTASGTFSPPIDWPGFATKVECLGSGGNGSLRNSASVAGTGGGGGEYAAETGTLTLASGTSYTVGTAGGTTNTSIVAGGITITAHFGATGTTTVPGAGGTGSTNATHHNGGAGGSSGTSTAWGGGGAAGPTGIGAAATSVTGGNADGGTVSGGAGAGPSGTEFDGTHGCGAGGAGATTTGNGFAGGLYGGGGGAHGTATGGTAAAGQPGLIVLTYNPAPVLMQRSNIMLQPPSRLPQARSPDFIQTAPAMVMANLPGPGGVPRAPFYALRSAIPQRAPDLYQNLLETTLAPVHGLPPGKQLTDLPPWQMSTGAPFTQGTPLTFSQRPFAQYDWPLPQQPQPPRNTLHARSFGPSAIVQQSPFAQYDWPLPQAIARSIPSESVTNLVLTAAAPQQRPFAQYEWRVPQSILGPAPTDPVTNLALTGQTPFRQTEWSLPQGILRSPSDLYPNILLSTATTQKPPGQQSTDLPPQRTVGAPSFTQGTPLTFWQRPFRQTEWQLPKGNLQSPSSDRYPNLSLTTPTTQRPFSQTDWPLPQSPYRLAPDLYQNLLETALNPPAGAKPFAQYDWPLPQQPQPPRNTLHARSFGPSATVQQPPFAQYDWPLPQTPAYPWAVEQHQNYLVFSAFIVGPGQQLTDLPRQPIATVAPDLYQNLLETTLRPAPSQGLPPGKQLTDLPPQRMATVAPYTQGAPIIFRQRPFAQYDWPVHRSPQPLISTVPTKWFAPSVTIQQPPFAQYDWPLPKGVVQSRPTELYPNIILSTALTQRPFRQTDWPLPNSPYRLPLGSLYSRSFAPTAVAQQRPFTQYDWPLPRVPPAGLITTSFSSPEALLALRPTPPLPPPLTQPNGRWRSVIAPGESSINDNNYLSPVVGEVGFTLFFDTTVAFSPLINVMTLVFTKPSGNQLEVSYPGFYAGVDLVAGNLSIQHGFVGYIFGPGDLDEAGLWSVFLERNESRASGIAHFRVLNLVERLESAQMS